MNELTDTPENPKGRLMHRIKEMRKTLITLRKNIPPPNESIRDFGEFVGLYKATMMVTHLFVSLHTKCEKGSITKHEFMAQSIVYKRIITLLEAEWEGMLDDQAQLRRMKQIKL